MATATALLNQRRFDDARKLLRDRIAQGLALEVSAGRMLLAEIGGLLIDIGSEGRIEEAVKEGLAILRDNRPLLKGFLTRASLEYNLGNAKIALAELRPPGPFVVPGLADHELLLAAKNHYWVARKAHDGDDDFGKQLGTNLGNALRKSGRITEALTAYDDIIAADPQFTMAHFHRGLALLVLEQHSGTQTITLLRQVASEYAFTAGSPDVPPDIRETAAKLLDHTLQRLNALGYDPSEAEHETRETQVEANQHSAYRQFVIRQHLGLSEHSLYCHCVGARRDDLMIATTSTPLTGEGVPRLELILNRLKAEFGTARLLYYQAATEQSWDLYEHEITYAELFEGEQVSMRTELLRTSFRLCLGILDKIALGICELFDVADEDEHLYFERFWRPQTSKGRARTRWNTLSARSNNSGLVALYSQATDLQSDGEWALFKAWRNDLEHRFLILTTQGTPPDLWKARQGTFNTRCVTLPEFTDKTLRLLQFTRSAIFNFTYCARQETRAHRNGQAITTTIQHKYPEPRPNRPSSRETN